MAEEKHHKLDAGISTKDGCRWLVGLLRPALRFSAALSVAWIALAMICLHWLGHRNPTSAFMLFLPGWLFSLPLLLLLPASLVWDFRRSGITLLLAIGLYLGPGLGYCWGDAGRATPQAAAKGAAMRIMTYNRGQSQGTSLQPFKTQWQPDLLCLQDAGGRAERYLKAPGYTEFTYGAGSGEFVLLSKFPILSTRAITCEFRDGRTGALRQLQVAARFEVVWETRPVVVYNVHLPTHRGMLLSERKGGFLTGVLGFPGTPWAEKRRSREAYWESSLEIGRQLAAQMAGETAPVIVAGDLNNPPLGPFYRLFSQSLADSHREQGQGYGYTFPGETSNPLALFRPWLRIDYILYSPEHWVASQHVTEPSRASQHRAVFAELIPVISR